MNKRIIAKKLVALMLVFCMATGNFSAALAKETAGDFAYSMENSDLLESLPGTEEQLNEDPVEATPSEVRKKTEAEPVTVGEDTAVLDTEYFGTLAFAAGENDIPCVFTELSAVTDWESCEPVCAALQKVRNTEDSILGDVIVHVDVRPKEADALETEDEEDTAEITEITYKVTFAEPEFFTEVQVYEVLETEEGETEAARLDSEVSVAEVSASETVMDDEPTEEDESEKEYVTVSFSAGTDLVLVLEFQGVLTEEEENYGCIVSDEFSFPEEELLTGAGNEEEIPNLKAVKLPTAYSSVEEGYVPAVRNQGSLGTCCLHAITAVSEISMIRNGYAEAEDMDYSEAALCYYHYHTVPDPLDLISRDLTERADGDSFKNGANDRFVALTLAGWKGMTEEENAPYAWLGKRNADPVDEQLVNGGTDLCFNSNEAILTGTSYISINQRDQVKQAIMNDGAVCTCYYASGSYVRGTDGAVYYYCPTTTAPKNHEIAIVGWNDTISRSCFNTDPGEDGAWLIRNSWGSAWGDGGYFWLSYADKSIYYQAISMKFVPAETYDHNYHYDGTAYPGSERLETGEKAGNIYQVKGDGAQKLNAVNAEVNTANAELTIKVYVSGEPMEDPEDGTPAADFTETADTIGNHTFPLEENIILQPGQYFSVVIESRSAFSLGRDSSYSNENSWFSTADYTEKGQSFICEYSGQSVVWRDLDAENSHEGTTMRIRAFTTDAEDGVAEPESITLDETSYRIQEGRNVKIGYTVLPAGLPDSVKPLWKSGDTAIATVNLDGTVTGLKPGKCAVRAYFSDTVYAEAEITVCEVLKVTFKAGKGKPSVTEQYIEPGGKAGRPADPVRKGYVFKGWYKEEGFENLWDPAQPVTEDLVLFAKWELNSSSISMYAKNGNGRINLPGYGGWDNYRKGVGSDREITRIVIEEGTAETPAVAEGTLIYRDEPSSDGSVVRYDVLTEEERTVYFIFDSQDGRMHGNNNTKFRNLSFVSEISGLNLLDTSEITDMGYMFYECSSLKKLDLSCFNTSSAIWMNGMFWGCSSLEELDMDGFDTSSVTYMSGMFSNCSSLEKLDLSGFDMSSVTLALGMFSKCTSLESVDLSDCNPSSITNMASMFFECKALRELDISSFSSEKLKNTEYMMKGCDSLEKVILGSGFHPDTAYLPGKTAERSEKFGKRIDGNWHLHEEPYTEYTPAEMCQAPAGIYYAFPVQYKVTFIDSETGEVYGEQYPSVNSSHVECPEFCVDGRRLRGWYTDSEGTGTLWDFENGKVTQEMILYAVWEEAENNVSFRITGGTAVLKEGFSWYSSSVPAGLTANYTKIVFLNTEGKVCEEEGKLLGVWDASDDGSVKCIAVSGKEDDTLYIAYNAGTDGRKVRVKNSFAFYDNKWLRVFKNVKTIENLDLLDTSSLTSASCMFAGLSSLEKLDLSGFITASVTNMASMFSGCSSLTELDLSSFITASVIHMGAMFSGCRSLTELDLSSFNTAAAATMASMFWNCSSLKELNLSGFSSEKLTNASSVTAMMTGCNSLEKITIGENFHPSAAYLPGATEKRLAKLGEKLDGNWHLHEAPFTACTPAEMCAAPAGEWYALPGMFTVTLKYGMETEPGSGVERTETVEAEAGKPVSLQSPERAGYIFTGWFYTEGEEKEKWSAGDAVVSDMELKAGWTPRTDTPYTVRDHLQNADGTYPETPSSVRRLTGTTDTLTEAAAREYEGYTAPESIEQKNISGDGSTCTDIYYPRKEYTLSFMTAEKIWKTESHRWGERLTNPGAPDRKNGREYRERWYTDSKLKTEWNFEENVMPAADMKLYASWTYISTGGTSGGSTAGGGGTVQAAVKKTEDAYSEFWTQGTDKKWRVLNRQKKMITNAWLCDDAVTANGKNVWYLLNTDGTMLEAPLVQDNTGNYYSLETSHNGHYGSLRYQNGTYDGIYMEFSQKHDGTFGAITNQSAIEALKAKYGVTKFGVDNSGCVYTLQF